MVGRSTIPRPPSLVVRVPDDGPAGECEGRLDERREQLSDVIIAVLRSHPTLNYFQGFHDIVQVLLLVLGKDSAPSAVSRLALLRIRDFMLPSLSPAVAHLELLPPILYAADAGLCRHLSRTQPYFALAATLTLYAHEIQDYEVIARLFDFLLAHEAAMAVYLFAAIVLARRDELFEIPADEPEMLHFALSKLPQRLRIEHLIQRAIKLFAQHPPESLPFRAWHKVSSHSVLKTARLVPPQQTLEEGQALLERHVRQLRNQELRHKALAILQRYRRPLGGIGLAIFIGCVSYWAQRTGTGSALLSNMTSLCRMIRSYLSGRP
jgi:TBC1 domain family member 20